MSFAPVSQNEWPSHPSKEHDDFAHGPTVDTCDPLVRQGFLRKVFGLVGTQLAITSLVCAVFMFEANVRHFVLHTPSMLMISFFASLGFLFAAQCNKDRHPANLGYLLGFTLAMAWSVGVVCARYQERGMGIIVLEAVGLTAAVTLSLTAYTLRSKADFSYMGAGLGASLWVLILGGIIAPLTGLGSFQFALAVGGAVIFSLYIVYDVYLISKRLSPDEYVPAAIALYLDILNLFLHLLRILGQMQSRD
eukprot:CAMPEP_0115840174 /NCGR_PEP_ID=MMETSP0287-20121206/6635_1 /TAXON_ID=412157 /ORGANISM="Chrysochromulina rotalis, Strain UIO044" /LENGTH=248 /DNA_ID=CAMNT_0003293777 /DNA_START=59 /DNA_END=805 /DNA_ORIENTATION=+